MSVSEVLERLAISAERSIVELGSQLTIICDNNVIVDAAFGRAGNGDRLRQENLLAQFCTLKPVVALACLETFVDDNLNEPVKEWLPEVRGTRCGESSLTAYLQHCAFGGRPAGRELWMTPERNRVRTIVDRMEWSRSSGLKQAYSEAAAWYIVGRAIEAQSGQPLGERVCEVTREMAFSGEMFLCGAEIPSPETISPGAALTRFGWQAQLMDTAESRLLDWNPGFGGYSSSRFLAGFYDHVMTVPGWAKKLCDVGSVTRFDHALQRDCRFGNGVMLTLSEHHFGDNISDLAFGHSGFRGQSFAFADPSRGLSVAYTSVGCADPDLAVTVRRPLLVDSILEDFPEKT